MCELPSSQTSWTLETNRRVLRDCVLIVPASVKSDRSFVCLRVFPFPLFCIEPIQLYCARVCVSLLNVILSHRGYFYRNVFISVIFRFSSFSVFHWISSQLFFYLLPHEHKRYMPWMLLGCVRAESVAVYLLLVNAVSYIVEWETSCSLWDGRWHRQVATDATWDDCHTWNVKKWNISKATLIGIMTAYRPYPLRSLIFLR